MMKAPFAYNPDAESTMPVPGEKHYESVRVGANPGDLVFVDESGKYYLANIYDVVRGTFVPYGAKQAGFHSDFSNFLDIDTLSRALVTPYERDERLLTDRVILTYWDKEREFPDTEYEQLWYQRDILPFSWELTQQEYDDIMEAVAAREHAYVKEGWWECNDEYASHSPEDVFLDIRVIGPGEFLILDGYGYSNTFSLVDMLEARSGDAIMSEPKKKQSRWHNGDRSKGLASIGADSRETIRDYCSDVILTEMSCYPLGDKVERGWGNEYTRLMMVEWYLYDEPRWGYTKNTYRQTYGSGMQLNYVDDIKPFMVRIEDADRFVIDEKEDEDFEDDELKELDRIWAEKHPEGR